MEAFEGDRIASRRGGPDYSRSPAEIVWELTRACAVGCRQCPVGPLPGRHPEELTTAEAFCLVDEISLFDPLPTLALTGGDPFMRPDLCDIVAHAADQGFTVSLAAGATAMTTECGSVRSDPIVGVYRTHPVFRSLRDPARLKGRCGVCRFRDVCGGCRARAYAMTGDCLAPDPGCSYRSGG